VCARVSERAAEVNALELRSTGGGGGDDDGNRRRARVNRSKAAGGSVCARAVFKCGGRQQARGPPTARRHGPNISGHNEVQADKQGENGRTVRPGEEQSAGKADDGSRTALPLGNRRATVKR